MVRNAKGPPAAMEAAGREETLDLSQILEQLRKRKEKAKKKIGNSGFGGARS